MAISDDASLYLADFGVSVIAGAVSGLGLLDQNSQMVIGDQVVTIDYGLTCEVALFGSLSYDESISVDGNSYKVRHEPMRLDDGTFCIVPLAKATELASNITTLAGWQLITQDMVYINTLAT